MGWWPRMNLQNIEEQNLHRADVYVTLDIDWAPDFVIDSVADELMSRQVPATWFVTHDSPAVDRLRQCDLFELGIHPNFLSGSTHGSGVDEVLDHCMQLVPDATSMRSHGLYQSTAMLARVVEQTPISIDVSLFLHNATNLAPIEFWWKGKSLTRVPYSWEDDVEMQIPNARWRCPELNINCGLQIFDFHPIHIYLNSSGIRNYERVKQRGLLSSLEPRHIDGFINPEEGTRTVFANLVRKLGETRRGGQIRQIPVFVPKENAA